MHFSLLAGPLDGLVELNLGSHLLDGYSIYDLSTWLITTKAPNLRTFQCLLHPQIAQALSSQGKYDQHLSMMDGDTTLYYGLF